MKLVHKPPRYKQMIERDKRRHKKALYTAAQLSTDESSVETQAAVQAKIRGVGLGKLAGAVGRTSSKRKVQKPKRPYGAIYARGGDESRAGQALESYTRGATIIPKRGRWLAFPTNAVPRTINRRRTTPMLYRRSGLQTSIGVLHFVQVNPRLALLVVRNVTLHPKTHQAKRAGKRAPRTRVPAKEVVAFILIKQTRRAVRFNKDREVWKVARTMPDKMKKNLEMLLAKG